MVGWHHQLNGQEFEQALGVSDGQERLACCSTWGRKELDMIEPLNNSNMSTELMMPFNPLILCWPLLLCPQSFPASRSFPMCQLFASGSQSIGASASASVLSMNVHSWFPLGLTDLISLLSKGLSSLLEYIKKFNKSKITQLKSRKVKVLVVQSYPILCNPRDCSPPCSSVHWILQTRIQEWVAIPSLRGSSWPKDWTWISYIAGRFFTVWAHQGSPPKRGESFKSNLPKERYRSSQ